ncbi:MAG: ParD-like family protein [Burkholderiales bacterium]|nr:ParD-like family protein [Burkholderiales bacterium]
MKSFVSKTNKAVRLNEDFYEFIKKEAGLKSRSVAGQLEHWSKIGMVIEKTMDNNEVGKILEQAHEFFKVIK